MTPFTDQLMSLPRYASEGASAIHPGFDRIQILLDEMQHPERHMSVALIAGTNGKGSTASMMAACLTAAGVRTGLHTSPHLLHVDERMRVDGIPPSAVWLEEQCQRYGDLFRRIQASFFEATFALSLVWFAHQKATHAVVEVGLGGRLDATNILDADISVITGVALDHMDLLGDTIPLIATEKAGIIKTGKPVVLGAMPSEARLAIENVAQTRNATVWIASNRVQGTLSAAGAVQFRTPSTELENVRLQLKGAHQMGNAAVALTALDLWLHGLPNAALISGLENTAVLSGLRARTETLRTDPLLMVDVGHNPDAFSVALATFLSQTDVNRAVLVVGLLADKDAAEVGRVLSETGISVGTVSIAGARGRSATALAHELKKAGVSSAQPFKTVPEALQFATNSGLTCLAMGSHVVAAEAIAYVESESDV